MACLGATGAQALLGPQTRSARRGTGSQPVGAVDADHVSPSAILRARDEPERVQMRERLVRDLALARQFLDDPPR